MLNELHDYAVEIGAPVFEMGEGRGFHVEVVRVTHTNECNDIYSISKNFTATAAGILIDRGIIKETDSVYDILHSAYPSICGEDWKAVTVAHVMTQTIGIDHGFLDIDVEDLRSCTDFLKRTLEAELVFKPGEHFTYSDSNFYLLSRIVAQASGEVMDAFLGRELFGPLEFQGQGWAKCPDGHPMGGTGLFCSVRDMVKFGLLYANMGVWCDRRILSERWVKKASTPMAGSDGSKYYGYSFWCSENDDVYRCGGMYGQTIIISPSDRHVIAWQMFDTADTHGRLSEKCGQLMSR